jgi:hypothetical protein
VVLLTSAFSLLGLKPDNMARRFLAALALAHSAAALLEGFVDVLVKVDVQVPPNGFAELKAAEADDGYDACLAADAVLLDCDREGHLDTTTLSNDAVDCLCCVGTTPISAVYSMCASYASVESAPTAYTLASEIYRVCSIGGDCRSGGSPRPSPTRTEAPAADVTIPAECSPMFDIYISCSAEMDFQTARMRDVASCFCQDQSGNYDTEFQDFASSCAPAARTELPEDYTVIAQFTTICEAFTPVNTEALVFTTAGSRTTDEPVVSSQTTTSASNPTDDTAGGTDEGETTSTSTGLAAPGAALPGLVTWFAGLATAALSFLFLI